MRILFALLTLSLLMPALAGAQEYDAAAQFSPGTNPNGVWSYGQANVHVLTYSEAFKPFARKSSAPLERGKAGVPHWSVGGKGPGGSFGVFFNKQRKPVTLRKGLTLAPGALVLQAPKDGSNTGTVTQFTAPEAGFYVIDATFTDLDAKAAKSRVFVIAYQEKLLDEELEAPGKTTVSLRRTVTLRKGAVVRFAISNDRRGETADLSAVQLTARITFKQPPMAFDAVAQFSPDTNPHQAWSYGFMDTAALKERTAPTLFTQHGTTPAERGRTGASFWSTGATGSDSLLGVFMNKNEYEVRLGEQLYLQGGKLLLYAPEDPAKSTVLQFTAPSEGFYTFEVHFYTPSFEVKNWGFSITIEGRALYEKRFMSKGSGSYTHLDLPLKEGEALRFAVHNAGDGSVNDAVELVAKIYSP